LSILVGLSSILQNRLWHNHFFPTDATYLLKAVQGFVTKTFPPYAISIQNEPLDNSSPDTYPHSTLTADVQGQIGAELRSLLDNNGLSSVKIFGHEDRWDAAGSYAADVVRASFCK
jgi:O-glycosyl hydrolase